MPATWSGTRESGLRVPIHGRDVLEKGSITAIADRGYCNSEVLLKCQQEGIETIVPFPSAQRPPGGKKVR